MKIMIIILILFFINPVFAQSNSEHYYIKDVDGSFIKIDASKFIQLTQDQGEEWVKDKGEEWQRKREHPKKKYCFDYCRRISNQEISELNDKLDKKQNLIGALERRIKILEKLKDGDSNE